MRTWDLQSWTIIGGCVPGSGEVIYCAGKTVEQTAKIFQAMARRETDVLGTRASPGAV